MGELFLRLLSVGCAACLPILLLTAARGLLPRAPRRLVCAVWKAVWIRLLLPFSLLDAIGLFPKSSGGAALSGAGSAAQAVTHAIERAEEAEAFAGFPVLTAAFLVWAFGAAAFLGVMAVKLAAMKRRLSDSVPIGEGVYESPRIAEPLVFGAFRPRIYLPCSMAACEAKYALLHERAHARRRDGLWLILARAAAAVYWFCPLVWAGYAMFVRDTELACDETVTAGFDREELKAYCLALLSCSAKGRSGTAPAVGFGGKNLKRRIEFIMKRSNRSIAAVLILAVLIPFSVACTAAAPVTPLTAANGGKAACEYPEYRDMDTSKGVLVLVSPMAQDVWGCTVIPAGGVKLPLAEALNRHSLTADQVEELIVSYGLDASAVTVHPYRNSLSSYYGKPLYNCADEIGALFGGKYRVGELICLRDFADFE